MLGRYTTGPRPAKDSTGTDRVSAGGRTICGLPYTRRSMPDTDSSTSAPTPSPSRPPRCAARWPRPRSATTCSATTRRSTPSRSGRPSCSARRPASSWRPAPMGNLVAQMAHVARGRRDHRRGASPHGHRRGGGARRRRRCVDPRAARATGRDHRPGRRSPTRSATRTTSTSRSPASSCLENTHAHSMGQPLTADYTASDRRHRPRARRPAPRRRRAVLQRRRRPRRAGATSLPRRRLGHLLPLEGPRLPGRVGRRRHARLHLAGPARAQARSAAACARWASSRRRASSPCATARTG